MQQALFTHPATRQRAGWLGFRVPRSRGLCLLFPSSHIPHILALSGTPGVAGGGGESCPVLGRPCSPGSSTTRWRTWRAVGKLAMRQGPGALQAGLGRPQHTWRAARNQPRGRPELAGSGEHRLRRWHCLPKVTSASRAAPGPQVPQLTASQRPEGSPASSQA